MSTPNFKDSIQLPKTDFPMKANLAQAEPSRIEFWTQSTIYAKVLEKNKDKTKFVMPDGPPYANGNLHVGHVLNKVLKDIVIKYKNMSGFKAAFIPGWDCHGLPIELNVTKKLGSKKNEMSKAQIRDLCRKEALSWVEKQKEQFIRLGVLGEWDNPYLTLAPQYEADEVRVLAKIFRNGVLFRGEKPVYWSPALQTAFAAAEVEYHDHKSPSIYVKFFVDKAQGVLSGLDKPVSIVIWTTTPWTLPANLAISLNAQFTYGVFDTGKDYIVIAKDLEAAVSKATGLELKLKKEFSGADLEGHEATHPFMNRRSKIILGDHVTLEAGTGAVHTAPGHGLDDYQVGLKYGLEVLSPVDPAGKYTSEVPQYEGMKIWDANKKIVEDLQASGHLIGFAEITHSYPHDPRSKTPMIFRATPQWFIRMDDETYNLREMALSCIKNKIQFVPKWGSQRLTGMLASSPDWCVSRQRIWGVPIPVFYCEACGESVANADVMEKVADKMSETGRGIEAYFETPAEEFLQGALPQGACPKCQHKKFKHSEDILDVWFDSGVCHTAVQMARPDLAFPADIYLEGSDQHRGWFQTSLISSLAAYGEPPFKALITHGFVNDSQGLKMSKSKGNVVDPGEIIKKSGAEILRLWVAYEDYGQDVSVGEEMFQRITETYRRIRNTLRFMLGNLSDFNPQTEKVEFANMPALDQWALIRLNELIEKTTQAYESYDFYKVYHALNNFFTVDLSAVYLDILKDRLYTGKKQGLARKASQTVLFEILDHVVRIMAPILSFLSEETMQYIPGTKPESVFLTEFPKTHPAWKNESVSKAFDEILILRDEVSKSLEGLRRDKHIGSNLDAKVTLQLDERRSALLNPYLNDLREILIVSQLQISKGQEFSIAAAKAEGEKCVRCWHYSTELSTAEQYLGICPKCVEALS